MQWAPRVKPWRIRQLYQRTQIGILDEDRLMHVGWGLYARCEAVLAFGRARRGEVPCPQCGETVYRQIYHRQHQTRPSATNPSQCPSCTKTATWQSCKSALRNRPICFDCGNVLSWNYTENTLTCPHCDRHWTWRQYTRSIKYRILLPCPHCGRAIRKPAPRKNDPSTHIKASRHWDYTCPQCKKQGLHQKGAFHCPHCSYEKPWRVFTQRQKRRVERLICQACDHTFTWKSWKQQHQTPFNQTGNPVPIQRFVSQWPHCKTPGDQLITIDRLIHALHGRGALAPLFIHGTSESVLSFLDDLASAP